jgi:hypothetical protein
MVQIHNGPSHSHSRPVPSSHELGSRFRHVGHRLALTVQRPLECDLLWRLAGCLKSELRPEIRHYALLRRGPILADQPAQDAGPLSTSALHRALQDRSFHDDHTSEVAPEIITVPIGPEVQGLPDWNDAIDSRPSSLLGKIVSFGIGQTKIRDSLVMATQQ